MKCVAVIQARMGSTRFPGKVMSDLVGKPMLEHQIQRMKRCKSLDEILIATTNKSMEDPIVNLGQKIGVKVFRGSEEDVLDRYLQAARLAKADVVVRITADCPLMDPDVIDEVVGELAENLGSCDYASNIQDRSFPVGLDVEAFTMETLEAAAKEATKSFHRIHVTPYIYTTPGRFRLRSVVLGENYSNYRWTVDTQEDLDLVRLLYRKLGKDGGFGWREALALMKKEPDLVSINSHVRQKKMEEG